MTMHTAKCEQHEQGSPGAYCKGEKGVCERVKPTSHSLILVKLGECIAIHSNEQLFQAQS